MSGVIGFTVAPATPWYGATVPHAVDAALWFAFPDPDGSHANDFAFPTVHAGSPAIGAPV